MADDEEQPNFRVLKIVVVVLGIAILAMTGIIIYKGVEMFSGGAGETDAPAGAAGPDISGSDPWTYSIDYPLQGRIQDSQLDGNVLMVRALSSGEGVVIYLIDVRNGSLIGQVFEGK
ncbi:hypothetical protein [Minwuia sp.]|uniref:hypothetical protein n=1 Tax=Minwuia sp. TaxID=2493630 RepID=UPI003A957FC9